MVSRDVLSGTLRATLSDGRYLAAAGVAGVVCFFATATVERLNRAVLVFDAIGLSLFCVTGATKAVSFGLGAPQAITLGAITGIGGGMLRDVLLREVPTVLRSELYAVPALGGAAVVAVAHSFGSDSPLFAIAGALVCLVVRFIGLRFGVTVPLAPDDRRPD